MFSDKKSKRLTSKMERNLIGEETSLIGDITSKGDFRIDGTIEGTIKTEGRVIVGKNGVIKGNVFCSDADIEGTFSGELDAKSLLILKSTATVSGKVSIGKLMVEPGAMFNTTCTMRGTIKELNNNEQNREKQEKSKAS